VALLAAAALALGACGGDDGGNGSGTTAAGSPDFTTNSGTGTTGTTERERTGTTEDRTTKTSEGRNDSGSDGGSGGSGSGKSGSGKSGSGNDDSGSKAQPNPQPGNVAKIAEKVCNSFLPKQISRDLEQDKTKPEDVARDYSRGFPEKQRESAYEGCLAGLKKR
jgi:hypothetical protein